ncbi:uncharacterized protein LOC130977117 [Arachis stenosperma]|uniref:uncharacterized protein LOC130946838 n=1 Tax=Arachis stenosperma TaxID=217475 RepID=UPI0025AC6330|nr:uncharacterized protein LOC130946838 [Arachis stenosperma]XP_057758119.1 uncharacterized protein LOC130977117 [Arachis stenosperma]
MEEMLTILRPPSIFPPPLTSRSIITLSATVTATASPPSSRSAAAATSLPLSISAIVASPPFAAPRTASPSSSFSLPLPPFSLPRLICDELCVMINLVVEMMDSSGSNGG